jgi:hypothetical protein
MQPCLEDREGGEIRQRMVDEERARAEAISSDAAVEKRLSLPYYTNWVQLYQSRRYPRPTGSPGLPPGCCLVTRSGVAALIWSDRAHLREVSLSHTEHAKAEEEEAHTYMQSKRYLITPYLRREAWEVGGGRC